MDGLGDFARVAVRVLRKEGPPLHLVFFITNRCDFACQHCFLIASGELNDKSRQLLTLDEIERVARSVPDLIAPSLTGGEPFLRNDYAEIVRCFTRHTRLRTLSTVTNGVSTERILPHLEQVLPGTDLSVFLSISLDGSEAAHDTIRRKPGAFGRTLDTIRRLRGLRERFPRLSVGVNSTYIGTNYADLMTLSDVLEEVRPHFVTLNMLRGVKWTDRQEGLSTTEYRRLVERKNALMARTAGNPTPLQQTASVLLWGSVCHHVEREASRFIPSTLSSITPSWQV